MEELSQFNFEVFLIKWFRFFRNNIWFIQIFGVLGLALGYTYGKYRIPEYESESIVYSSLLSDERASQIINDLSEYTSKKSYGILSEKLGITVDQASKIRLINVNAIEVKPILVENTKDIYKDYLQNCIEIELTVTDPNVIYPFQKGLLDYFEKNEFLLKLKKGRDENLSKMIVKIEEQIATLEELQKNSLNSDEAIDGFVINTEFNSSSKDLIFLLEKKYYFEEELQLKSIEILKPFFFPETPESKNIIFLAAGLILGLFMGIGLAVLRKINSMY